MHKRKVIVAAHEILTLVFLARANKFELLVLFVEVLTQRLPRQYHNSWRLIKKQFFLETRHDRPSQVHQHANLKITQEIIQGQ
jgi:hypothetical protein